MQYKRRRRRHWQRYATAALSFSLLCLMALAGSTQMRNSFFLSLARLISLRLQQRKYMK